MRKAFVILCVVMALLSCGGVQRQVRQDVDSLCRLAYDIRYTDIDSSRRVAQRAYDMSQGYDDGKSMALNLLAYARYQQMDYDGTLGTLDSLSDLTSNQVLLLCADVMRMKVYQRVGDGRGFYEARSSATKRLHRINEDIEQLGKTDLAEYNYAWAEYHIISSTYYYYQERYDLAKAEMAELNGTIGQMGDVTQLLYYYYMMGSGGLVDGTYEEVALEEFRYLMDCYIIARRSNVLYFEANALQSLATRLRTIEDREIIKANSADVLSLLMEQHMSWMPDSASTREDMLPLALARHALSCFLHYDDLFQTACVHRTIGELESDAGHYEHALESLGDALACVNEHHHRFYPKSNKVHLSLFNENDIAAKQTELLWIKDDRVKTVPEWMALIREQLSILYSAMDNKPASDYNRNIYLDILESTSQNREMESRMQDLEDENASQRRLLWAAAGVLTLLLMFVGMTYMRMKKHDGKKKVMKGDMQRLQELADQLEEAEEGCNVSRMRIQQNKTRNSEKRAKVSLAQAVVPFLERIINEVGRMKRQKVAAHEQLEYVNELSDQIMEYNDILTEWIKVEQGQLSLQISTIELRRLFAILDRGHYAYDQKGVTLNVVPTDLCVKADEALTMFMLNTLADNARKFTPSGGSVTVEATATDEYVELSVSDTGCGMSEEDVDIILSNKAYDASKIGSTNGDEVQKQKGFGFGLMNCKGIIEKYKKTANKFRVCMFGIDSQKGKGSRFYFRLPRVLSLLIGILLSASTLCAQNPSPDFQPHTPDSLLASYYYDKVYECNLNGYYLDAVSYADSALYFINPDLELFTDPSMVDYEPLELLMFNQGEAMDYQLLIMLRNEIAISALALHEWVMYEYNNGICTNLHKLCNQDATLPSYCDELAKTEAASRQLTAVLVALSLVTVFFIYLYFSGKKRVAGRIAAELEANIDRTNDVLNHLRYEENRLYVQNQVLDNCLSTIKHESMYYPSRIKHLVTNRSETDDADRIDELDELTAYYKQLYTLLCGQAERQVAQQTARREHVGVAELLKMAQKEHKHIDVVCDDGLLDVETRVDSTLLREMLHQLFKHVKSTYGEEDTIRMSFERSGQFLTCSVFPQGMHLSDEEAHNLFYPDASRIPLLIVKQIIRDFDAMNNNPGLRLVAEEDRIWWTLPL